MSQLNNPHDAFFKEVFSQKAVAKSFLENYLPSEITALFDLNTLIITRDSFVDRNLRAHHSDILYQVVLRDGGQSYIYLLFEHKSYPDRQVAFQLLRYMMQIWEQQRAEKDKLFPIFPIVVYHGLTKWRIPLELVSLVDGVSEAIYPYFPNYRYWLCDLSQYSDEEIIGEVYLQIGLLLLKYILRDELRDRIIDILELLQDLEDQDTALGHLKTILQYLSAGTNKVTDDTLQKAIRQAIPEGDALMKTLVEQWLEQGIQQGIQQGIRQEQRHGLLRSINLGLKLKFGVEGMRLLPEINRIEDNNLLYAIYEALTEVNTLTELRFVYHQDTSFTATAEAGKIHESPAPYIAQEP
ncbi:MAG TPA: Rpn family recombination-promoting nuclease/putative transposase [Chloroflexi bacterium]|nr:Rpn family recombination-promoting nuclease/putative transposase [Chloroflexota bacterium]